MEQVRLGRTGLSVSKLAFGGIPIQRASEEDAVEVVRKCFETGINFFDTANSYTTSEARIGKALAGHWKRVVIATKTQARDSATIEAHIQLSLKHLGVDSVDLYQFHNISTLDMLTKFTDPKGPRAVVEAAKKAGKVKHIGISSHSMDVAKEAVKTGLFETIMFPFDVVSNEAEEQLLPLCRQQDMGFIAMKPLAVGMMDQVRIPLKYLFQFDDVVTLLGMEKLSDLTQALEVYHGPRQLTEADRQEIRQLRESLGKKFCHRCDYCQPCPQEIRISFVMYGSGHVKRLAPSELFGGWMADAFENAMYCNQCGICESKCPYELPVRDMIAEQVAVWKKAREEYQKSLSKG